MGAGSRKPGRPLCCAPTPRAGRPPGLGVPAGPGPAGAPPAAARPGPSALQPRGWEAPGARARGVSQPARDAIAPPGGSGRGEWPVAAMELPDLGAPCSEAACRRLDFLPLKCDACERIFCADHVSYARHGCTSAYKKDVQVPVCPLCNTPVPTRRGEMPDAAVGAHMDRECRADPAQRPRKIFTNKCGKPGCRQREMMPVLCEQCRRNFCLKHRHPLDHDCAGAARAPVSRAGHAALARAQAAAAPAKAACASGHGPFSRAPPSPGPPASGSGGRGVPAPRSTSPPAAALQNGLSEEEALQRALAMSLAEAAPRSAQAPSSTQEDEDLALARALSASEEEYRRQQQGQSRTSKPSNCSMS